MGRPKGSTNIPWGSVVARLRKHPGRWMLLPEMRSVTDRTIMAIRRQERRELRMNDGVIRCRRRATVWLEDGTVRCALILKFEERKAPNAGES